MSAETQEILTAYGQAYDQVMLSSLPSVTGKTKASVRHEVTPGRLRGYARGFVKALETGRGPRKGSSYSEFDKGLEDWLNAKGFPTKKTKTGKLYYQIHGQWFSAKSLAWKINKKGDRTFRTGGKEVYSQKLEQLINSLIKDIEAQKLQEYRTSILTLINGSIGSKKA